MVDALYFVQVKFDDFSDDRLNFQITVPESVLQVPPDTVADSDLFFTLANLQEDRFEIQISICNSAREVDPFDLLALSLKADGFNILSIERHNAQGGIVGEAFSLATLTQRICFSHVVQDGSRIFRVDCILGKHEPKAFQAFARGIVNSFELLNPENRTNVEEYSIYDFTGFNRSFTLPKSWFRQNEGRNASCQRLDFVSKYNKECLGRMTVEAESREGDFRAVKWFESRQASLHSAGFTVGGAVLQRLDQGQSDSLYEEWLCDPPIRSANREFSAPTWLVADSLQVFVISMLGPSLQDSPYWWAVNKRAFELIRDSLRIGEQALEEKKPPQPIVDSSPKLKPKFPDAGLIQ